MGRPPNPVRNSWIAALWMISAGWMNLFAAGIEEHALLRQRLIADAGRVVPGLIREGQSTELWPVFFSQCIPVPIPDESTPRGIRFLHPLVSAAVDLIPESGDRWSCAAIWLFEDSVEFGQRWMQGIGEPEKVVVANMAFANSPGSSDAGRNQDMHGNAGEVLGRVAALSVSVNRWRSRSPVAAESLLASLVPPSTDPRSADSNLSLERLLSLPERALYRQMPSGHRPAFRAAAFVDGPRRTLVLMNTLDPTLLLLVSGSSPILTPVQKVRLMNFGAPMRLAQQEQTIEASIDAAVEQVAMDVDEVLSGKLAELDSSVAPLLREAAKVLDEQREQNRLALEAADRAIASALFRMSLHVGLEFTPLCVRRWGPYPHSYDGAVWLDPWWASPPGGVLWLR